MILQKYILPLGGTESDNTAIKGIARAYISKGNHIITSSIEHPAILESCKSLEAEGFKVTYLPVDSNGYINLNELKRSITSSTTLISIMYANNEIGTIQPLHAISKIAKEYNVLFHTDAVQVGGVLPLDVEELGVDSLSLSAHKFYGPKGVGVLYLKNGVMLNKFMTGGHQERGIRAGTENVAGIVGTAKALELAYQNLEINNFKIKKLRDYCLNRIVNTFPNVKVNGGITNRLPGNCNISFKNINGNKLLQRLDANGICLSTGSACSSELATPSHVLSAIKTPKEYIHGSLRITIGKNNTKEEIDYLFYCLKKILQFD